MRRILLCAALVSAICLGAAGAHAQVPTVDPRGGAPAPAPAPAPAGNDPVIIQVPVQPGGSAGGIVDENGVYHFDEVDGFDTPDDGVGAFIGPVPPFHVVRRGDTLWDICWFYFNNPWEWPKIWSFNPTITNPHWIFPGDLVRLYPGGLAPDRGSAGVTEPTGTGDDNGEDLGLQQPAPIPRYGVRLRQIAVVERSDLDFDGAIVGSVEEKSLLATGDAVYISYKGDPPKIGQRFSVYAERKTVKHPEGGKNLGAYVKILGELVIESVKQGKLARARITDSVDVIERGHRVGPVERSFRTVEPQRNEVDLQGTIVAMVGGDELIGQNQVIFIDKGSAAGVEVGNRMYAVRRGDAYEAVLGPSDRIGQDDGRFPARAIGEIIIVQTGKNMSAALVILALQEIGVGDRVIMREAAQ